MSKLTTLLLLTGVLVAGSATALAAEEPGWYLEGQFGEATLDTQLGVRRAKFFDDEDSTAILEVGYSVNRYFAVQAGFLDLGEFTGNGALCPEDADVCIESLLDRLVAAFPGLDPQVLSLCVEGGVCDLVAVPLTAEVSAWSLSAIPRLPLGDRLTIRGRVGVVAWETDISAGFGLGRFDGFSDEDLMAGVGVEVKMVERLSAVVEYRTTDFDIDLVSVGVSWRVD